MEGQHPATSIVLYCIFKPTKKNWSQLTSIPNILYCAHLHFNKLLFACLFMGATKDNAKKRKSSSSANDDAEKSSQSFSVGSVVWAKLPGYPHWPGRVSNLDDRYADKVFLL